MIIRLNNVISMGFGASLEFVQGKIDDLSTSNSALQTKLEEMEKK